MLGMILLLVTACGLTIWTIHQDRKKGNWFYIVDNLTIDVCRKYDNLAMAKEMYDFCIADGHEAYLKRVRGF